MENASKRQYDSNYPLQSASRAFQTHNEGTNEGMKEWNTVNEMKAMKAMEEMKEMKEIEKMKE